MYAPGQGVGGLQCAWPPLEQVGPACQAVIGCEGPHTAESCCWAGRVGPPHHLQLPGLPEDRISQSPARGQAAGTELSDKGW